MALVNSGFYMWKILWQLSTNWAHTLQALGSSVLGQKDLKNIGFTRGAKLLAWLGWWIINFPTALIAWAGPVWRYKRFLKRKVTMSLFVEKIPYSVPIHMLVLVFIWKHKQNGDDMRNMVRCRSHLSNSLLACKMNWIKWIENLVCPRRECDVKHVFCIINLMWLHMTSDT